MKVATLAQGRNPVAKLTAIGSPIIAASRLAVTLAEMFNAVTVPDDDAECAKWLERIPTEAEMDGTIAMLDRSLMRAASPEQAQALCVIMLDGYGRAAGESAATYVAALAASTEDYIADEDEEPLPISLEVIALAIVRIWREAKFMPVPCEFRAACIATRERVYALRLRLLDALPVALDLRANLEWRLTPRAADADDDLGCWLDD
jgi:hypothetical protein